jgi:hypothetical protein
MSKLIIEPIQLQTKPASHIPGAFLWRGRRYRITEAGGSWTETGHWWEGKDELRFFRVLTDRNLVVDLCFEPQRRQWLLYAVHD